MTLMKTSVKRDTKETQISLELEFPGEERNIDIGCGFLTHMLDLMCYRAGIGITLKANGDTEVDFHHLTEDIGIAMGQALRAVAKTGPIVRYGWCLLPMDGSLASIALDFSGRGGLCWGGEFPTQKCNEFDMELVPEFFRALTREGGITLHVDLIRTDNSHHAAEAVFKGVGMVFKEALQPSKQAPSTKGLWL